MGDHASAEPVQRYAWHARGTRIWGTHGGGGAQRHRLAHTHAHPCSRLPLALCAAAIPCPALANDNSASWNSGIPGVTSTGTCVAGYGGSPQRLCNINGWGQVTDACTRTCRHRRRWRRAYLIELMNPCHPASCFARPLAELTCSSVTTGTVSYAQTAAGTSFVTGTCASGYAGSPQRNCSITGAWVDVGTATCTRTAVPRCIQAMQHT